MPEGKGSATRLADKVLIAMVIAISANALLMWRNEGVTMERMDTFDREIIRLTEGQQALRSKQQKLEIVVYGILPQELFPE